MLSSTLGHRVHIPTRFVAVGLCGTRGGQAGGRVVPGTEMAKNLLNGEGVAEDVLGQALEVGLGLGRDRASYASTTQLDKLA